MPRKLQNLLFCGVFFKNIFSKFETFKFNQLSWSNFKTLIHYNVNACIFLLIAVFFALFNTFYVFLSFNQVDSGVTARQHSQQTLQLANQLITNITLAQTKLHGYVNTNQQELLTSHTKEVERVNQYISLLQNRSLTSDEQKYWVKFSSLIFAQLKNMADVVAIQNNNNNNSAALAILNNGENQQLIESIGSGHQQFINAQMIFLDKNEAMFQNNMQHFHQIIIINSGLILLFAFTFAYFFYYQSKQKARNIIYAKTQKLLLTQQEMTNKLMSANKVLEENEEKLSLTLNSMGHAVIATDLFGRITRINKVAEQLTGWSSADAIARPVDEVCQFVNANTLRPVASTIFETLAQANTQALPANTVLTSKNGEKYVVADTCAPIFNIHNTVQGAVLVFRDVSKQELIAKKLSQSEELYRATFDHASVGIAHISATGQFLKVNKCFADLTQFSADELLKQTFQNLTHPSDRGKVTILLDQLILGEINCYTIEKRYVRKDKSIAWVDASVSCMRKSNGDIDYIIAVLEDITDKKKANTDSLRFFTLSQELLCVVGCDGYFKQINEPWQDLLGYTREELLAVPILNFLHKDDFEKTKQAQFQLKNKNTLHGFENRYICKNGSVRYLSWNVFEDHEANLLYASARDITERKQYEDNLILQSIQFKTLIEQAPVGIHLVDKNLRMLHHNSLASKAFNQGDLNGRELIQLLSVSLNKRQAEAYLAVYRQTLETGMPFYENEYKQESTTGDSPKYWSWQINRITLSNGEFGVVCYFQDITERVLIQHKVFENEARFRTLFDHGPVAMYFCDMHGKIQLFNQVAAEIWQIEPIFEQHEDDFRADFKYYELDNTEIVCTDTCVANVLNGSIANIINKEIILERADGSRVNLVKNVVAIKDANNKISGAISCFFDVTYRRLAEVALINYTTELEEAKAIAEKANAAKSEFLSSMSHELRTPLNAILGFAQLMQAAAPTVTTSPTPIQLRNTKQILDAGWYLLELINDILDLAQIESGKQPLFLEPVLLNDVLRDCAMLIEPLTQKNNTTVEFAPMPLTYVQADKTRLKQVLINLLTNAIKYNRKDGLVSVDCIHKKGSIKINVRDTGVGLTKDQLSHLFEPFNRLGQEAHATEGTGIGLIVSKKLIELMQGHIGAKSTINEGSVFWISLISITPNSINKNDTVKKLSKLNDASTNITKSNANKKTIANRANAQIAHEEFLNHDIAKVDNKTKVDNETKVKNEISEPVVKTMVFEGSDLQKLLALQSQSLTNAFKKIGLQSSIQSNIPIDDEVMQAAEFPHNLVNTLLAEQSPTPIKKLLYVEDNSANFNLVQEMVALRGDVQLKGATDGVSGLSIAETWLPDVILMDINLTDLSGFEVLKLLGKNPATAATPVIAISANAMLSEIQKGIEAGFFRYITKPVKLEELTRALDFAFEYAQMTKHSANLDVW